MKVAFVLHLYYPDIGVELIERIAALGRADIDLIATHVGLLHPLLDQALDRIPGVVERIKVPNRDWDIGPLFELIPLLIDRGYDVICKLHTKKGSSGYAAEWRELAYEGLIGDETLVSDILSAFKADALLSLVGPVALFKSSASNMFANAEMLAALAPLVAAPRYPSSDWGFFAGTFFWARTSLVARVKQACDVLGTRGAGRGERDGEIAHAAERLFGLAALSNDGRIGTTRDGALHVFDAPGAPDRTPIVRTLVDQAERSVGNLDPTICDLIKRANPLVHYIRHGRDADALDPNPYFTTTWYNRVNEDVAAAGMHPLYHYLHHGWLELRSTGPLFDGAHYQKTYADVTGNPLEHFMHKGLPEGRSGLPVSDPTERAMLKHFYQEYDLVEERRFLDAMGQRLAANRMVSVIMPAFNRQATIAAAIRSVLGQTHAHLELLIVDDGSTDGTIAVIEPFLSDPRVRLFRSSHVGVSEARNVGIDHAQGELLAYLDSDNRWVPWFLDVLLRAMANEGNAIGYSAISLRDDLGHLTGYRGSAFDWNSCLERNYIDLNCFMHEHRLVRDAGGFDPMLKRMVDWDLILRITRQHKVTYAPFVGCDYFDGRNDRSRITTSEPAAYEKVVRTKNQFNATIGSTTFMQSFRLSFAIKIAAPRSEAESWGDYHFAEGLAAAIERAGHGARVDAREEWAGHELAEEDVVIVLRGLIPYQPRQGQIAFLWAISHPDQIGYDEYDAYTRVFAASPSLTALLSHIVTPPVETMLQATDPERFSPSHASEAPGLLFCGNSRGEDRNILRWAIAAGYEPVIYGSGWEDRVPEKLVAAPKIANLALGPLYAGSGAVLNDHWPSMKAFGIVSNRLFDVAAAGGRAISDAVQGIDALFGDAVAQVDTPDAFARAVRSFTQAPESESARVQRAKAVAAGHSFDARARRLVDAALGTLGLAPPPAIVADTRLHIHIIARHGAQGPQSSAYIRLIAPLTDASVSDRVRVTIGTSDDEVPQCDICIVQRTAYNRLDEVNALVRELGRIGASLVTDVDDALCAIGPDHPEAAFYRPLAAALDRAIAASAETWFSTSALADMYIGIAHNRIVFNNTLDPRLWRDWRRLRPPILANGRAHLLYMGTYTHAADWQMLRPHLDRLHAARPDAFKLTLIGVAPDIEPAPWLSKISPPAGSIAYPRFVRWLRDQGPFDVGLAPLVDTAFNRGKSDIKMLDYAALGALPILEETPAYRSDPHAADIIVQTTDWYAALIDVLDNRDAARQRAAAAETYLWRSRCVSQVAPAMLARLEALADR